MVIISDSSARFSKNTRSTLKSRPVLKQLRSYNIDLEKASGNKSNIIAIPAVFVIGKDWKILFSYANEDYKTRAANKDILDTPEGELLASAFLGLVEQLSFWGVKEEKTFQSLWLRMYKTRTSHC